MKVIILAGGLPSTIIEKDEKMPKPLAEIGGHPLLWHIMKLYSYYGHNDFIICTGYKGDMIKDYFMNFYIYQSDITVDLSTNEVKIHKKHTENWNVSIVDTGISSSIIERIVMVKELIKDEPVIVTYGDCLSDIDVSKMIEEHQKKRPVATVAVAHPTGRNEIVALDKDGNYQGLQQNEKQQDSWVNACGMIFEPRAFSYLSENINRKIFLPIMDCLSIYEPVETYQHEGFWVPVETVRDKTLMEFLWAEGQAPWKVWKE